jgi:predicted Rossmann fold flavoprotein
VKQYDVIIVGAGVAGLIAAGRCANRGAEVLLLEKMRQSGRKLLITGKGRCNITNEGDLSSFYKHIHPNGRFLKHAFSEFFNKDIIRLLHENGVETVRERGGRIFPASSKAADVLEALMRWVKANNVDIQYGCRVEKLITENNVISGIVTDTHGQKTEIEAKNVILCTGGNSYPSTGSSGDGYILARSVGHTIVTVRPSLVPLITEGPLAGKLQGLSLKNVKVVVWSNGKKSGEAFGEMLFTHFGLSGPIILTLSRLVVDQLADKKKVEISVDLKPALDEQKLDNRLLRDLNEYNKKQLENIFKLWLPAKMIPVFLELTGIDPHKEGNQLTGKERRKIRLLMKDLRFTVSGHRSFKEAIITAGGISTAEIDSKTMESKLVKNLFFAGELIDLDADTGGYNLQIAYSTAWLAATSCIST